MSHAWMYQNIVSSSETLRNSTLICHDKIAEDNEWLKELAVSKILPSFWINSSFEYNLEPFVHKTQLYYPQP